MALLTETFKTTYGHVTDVSQETNDCAIAYEQTDGLPCLIFVPKSGGMRVDVSKDWIGQKIAVDTNARNDVVSVKIADKQILPPPRVN